MSITGMTATLTPVQALPKQVVPAPEKASSNQQPVAENPREARAKAFYTREAEPWKGKSYIYSEFGGPKEERPLTKEMYLDDLRRFSNLELRVQQSIYSEIRNELGVFRPELASKNFSYTLGDDAQIKSLNQDPLLTEDDLQYLTKRFNDHRRLRSSVQEHARMAMAIVDHDDKAFGGQYKLDLLNIQYTLDYGKLALLKPEKMHEAFVRQVIENGERREEPLVDVVV